MQSDNKDKQHKLCFSIPNISGSQKILIKIGSQCMYLNPKISNKPIDFTDKAIISNPNIQNQPLSNVKIQLKNESGNLEKTSPIPKKLNKQIRKVTAQEKEIIWKLLDTKPLKEIYNEFGGNISYHTLETWRNIKRKGKIPPKMMCNSDYR